MTSPKTRTRLVWRGGKKVCEHRWLMEQHLGRALLATEHVHHRDGNPLNNELSNLEVLNAREHMLLHKVRDLEPKPCANCGQLFTGQGKHRHRQMCCTSACAQAMRVRASSEARR